MIAYLLIGIVIGAVFGLFVGALLSIAKKGDK